MMHDFTEKSNDARRHKTDRFLVNILFFSHVFSPALTCRAVSQTLQRARKIQREEERLKGGEGGGLAEM